MPAPSCARAQKQTCGFRPPARAPHCARQTQPVRTRPGARHPTRSRAARSRQEARLPSLDTTTTAARVADISRLRHGCGLRPRLTTTASPSLDARACAPAPSCARAQKQTCGFRPPTRAPHCARQAQPVRTRPGARHPTRSRAARSRQEPRLPSLDTTTTAARVAIARAPRRLRPSASPDHHRFAHRLTLALARRRRAAPAPRNKRAASGRPRPLRIAPDRHSRSAARGPALSTPREAARRGHAKGRDFSRSTQQPPLRASLSLALRDGSGLRPRLTTTASRIA